LDRRAFPRKKPCGEFLSPACLPLLAELGLLAPLRAAGAAAVTGMQVSTARARVRGAYIDLGPYEVPGHGLGVRREVLDTQAVAAALRTPGVTALLGWRVRAPIVDGRGRVSGLVVDDPLGQRSRLHGRFVVGADGIQSRVAAALGWRERPRAPDRFAVVARFRGVEPTQDAGLHVMGGDYLAVCPIDAGLFTVNLVVDRAQLPRGASSLAPFLLERARRVPALARALSDARLAEPVTACGPVGARVRRCTAPGVALAGDACGFVDPMTGEGLYFAMHGAALLADAVDALLRDPAGECDALRRYERARRREFALRHALARLLQRGLRHPGVPPRIVAAMARMPSLCHLLLGLTGDYLPPRGILSPRVWRSALSS
jgi:flavin-dependent dehydrogenase